MAQLWEPKGATEAVDRRWHIDLAPDDAISTVSVSATGVTATAGHQYDDAVITLSGGVAGVEGVVLVTVVTSGGLSFVDTFYIPIRASTILRTVTVLDVCSFALRKITGDGETPTAEQMTVALEYLVELLTHWRFSGADVGVSGSLVASDTLDVPDDYIPAVKWNLRLQVHNHYGADLSTVDLLYAEETRRAVTNRVGIPGELDMPRTLANGHSDAWTLFQ